MAILDPFQLEHTPEVPAAYISFVEGASHSAKQVIVEIDKLTFVPQELIFDLDSEGRVVGVELL